MKYKYSGQISLETAIVMPIIMVVVATFMSIALYMHDVITIKSYGYSLAMEFRDYDFEYFAKNINNKIIKAPLFVMGMNVKCLNESGEYIVVIHSENKESMGWLSVFFKNSKDITINIEKKLNTEIIYAAGTIYDKIE